MLSISSFVLAEILRLPNCHACPPANIISMVCVAMMGIMMARGRGLKKPIGSGIVV